MGTWKAIGRRLLQAIPVLALVSMATMLLLNLLPGDPAQAILGEQATPAQLREIRHELRLDESIPERYAHWLTSLAQGDLGRSLRSDQPVLEAILQRLPVTLELAVLAHLLAMVLAVLLGVLAATKAGRRTGRIITSALSVMVSVPGFVTALVAIYLFAVTAEIFPVTGWARLSDGIGENLRYAALPVICLALGELPFLTRLLIADLTATLKEDFVLAARTKGLPERTVLFRHALRPSSFSIMTFSALGFGRLLGGTVIAETIFALPGLGLLMSSSIQDHDVVMVQGVAMFVAIAYVAINLTADALYVWLDPRIRVRG